MPFFSVSFSFSLTLDPYFELELEAEPSESSDTIAKGTTKPYRRESNISISSSSSTDPTEAHLSPSTQRLQQRIRARLHARRGDGADAASLAILLNAEDTRRRREGELDAESLAILLRATAEAEEDIPVPKTTGMGTWASLSSSFEDLGGTPCPSPRPRSRRSSFPGARGEAWEVSAEDGEFEQSTKDSRARRDESGILRSAGRAEHGDSRVDELMRYYDELMARNPTIPLREDSCSSEGSWSDVAG